MGLVLPSGGTGTGLIFPATQAPSSGANTLDDYEEGTWTPTLVGGTTPGSYSIAVTSSSARYTKLGRIVDVSAHFTVTVSSPGTGNAVFGGLPFTRLANSYFTGALIASSIDFLATTVMATAIPLTLTSGETTFGIGETQDLGGLTLLPVTALSTGSQLGVAFRYIV